MTKRTALKARGMFALGAIAGVSLVAGCGGGSDEPAEPETKDPQTVITEASPGVVEIIGKAGDTTYGGSGFIYDAGPPVRILTNAHVVEGLSSVQVKVGDQLPTVAAQVLGQAPCDDVAVLELPTPPPEVTTLPLGDSDALESGAQVVSLGYGENFQKFKQQTVTSTEGSVSNADVSGTQVSPDLPTYPALVQHTAALSPGSSGGPLLNDQGEVVGINTLSREAASQENYSIDINTVEGLLPDLEAGVDRAFVGWAIQPLEFVPPEIRAAHYVGAYGVSFALAKQFVKFDEQNFKGLYVLDTSPGSPADKKVFTGDLITDLDGTSVQTVSQVCKVLQSKSPGDTLEVGVTGLTSVPDLSESGNSFVEDIKLPTEQAPAEPTTEETTTSTTGE